MNHWIEPVNVIEVCKAFCMANEGDEATTEIILDMGAELLYISQDELLQMME